MLSSSLGKNNQDHMPVYTLKAVKKVVVPALSQTQLALSEEGGGGGVQ